MKKNVFIVLLIFIIIGLSFYLIYDKVIVKDNQKEGFNNIEETVESQKNAKSYTYKDVAGNYYFEANIKIEDLPDANRKYFLILEEDGTYCYDTIFMAHGGHIGNYMIVDNTIVLNHLFSTGNDEAIVPYDGSEILQISDNNNLIMQNKDDESLELSEMTFERTDMDFEQYSIYSFDKVVDNKMLSNTYTYNEMFNN